MRKRILIVVGIVLSALFLQASKPFIPKTLQGDIQKILHRGKIIVAINAEDHSPFHMVDQNGKLIGIDIEIAETIAKHLKVPVEYLRSTRNFDEVIDQVVRGEADLAISKLSYTPERALRAAFTKPYIMLHKAILVNRLHLARLGSDLSIKKLLSLKGIKIGTIAGSSYVAFAREIFSPSLELYTDTDWDKVIAKVESGECFGGFRDENEFKKILIKKPKMNLNALTIVLKEEEDPICVVLPQGQQEFLHWVNDLLIHEKSLRFELGEILKKYRDNL